jgi:uncharacterized protein (DUF2062 family)
VILRKIGKTFLGNATPFHLVLSCVFGGWLSFAAPLGQAPAYWVVLAALILVLPVNLFLAALVGLVAYPLHLLLLPASFHVGRLLLDGPTRPLFEALINAPFFALMGLEYYAHTGGILVGGLLGGLLGWAVVRFVRRLRRAVRGLDTKSDRFRQWSGKWYVGLATWVLLGARPKAATYERIEAQRIGKPVRIPGVIVAVLLVAVFLLASYALSGPILTRALRGGLERANGATVDLERAEIALEQARVLIDALAMADPEQLDTDLLRGLQLEADIGVGDLLTRRFKVDKLVLRQASSGAKRETPGRLTGTEPRAQDAPEPGEAKTIDDYLKDAERWRDRLAQARRWLERLSGPPDPEQEPKGLGAQLDRWVDELGYLGVAADHLIAGAPRLTIGELRIEGLQAMQLGGKAFDVVGENLSTHPRLLDATPHLSIRARDGSVAFDVVLAGAAKGQGTNEIEVLWKGLPGDAIGQRLKTAGAAPIQGGTIDFEAKGTWGKGGLGTVDLPFQVTLHNTMLALPGVGKPEKIDHLELPLRVTGPLDDPRILFRQEDLAKALVAAGKGKLAGKLGQELDKHVSEDVKDKVGGLLDKLKGGKK